MQSLLRDMLSTSQAARLVGVSENGLRYLMRTGRLPHEVTPLGALIERVAVEQLVAQRAANAKG